MPNQTDDAGKWRNGYKLKVEKIENKTGTKTAQEDNITFHQIEQEKLY
jgi:hypothetical protein